MVECARTLQLIEVGLGASASPRTDSVAFHPTFEITSSEFGKWSFELLPGHERWGLDLKGQLANRGSQFRENADALITELVKGKEELILALEFCGALPAGNNAWQRHGRALGFGQAKIPYLILNEIGGEELDSNRDMKANRLPHPAVPFSFLKFSNDLGVEVFPVYQSASSASDSIKKTFDHCFDKGEAARFLIDKLNHVSNDYGTAINEKAMQLVEVLTSERKISDTPSIDSWRKILTMSNPYQYFSKNPISYKRRLGSKVKISKMHKKFITCVEKYGRVFYSKSFQFCIIDSTNRSTFMKDLQSLYGPLQFLSSLQGSKPLMIVFVTGFKPRGDDSRPDRGLVPFARMLAGKDIDVLAYLWGPAKSQMLRDLEANFHKVAQSNGLIESLSAASDYVLVDSVNHRPFFLDCRQWKKQIPASKTEQIFQLGEHDVDSVIHFAATEPKRSQIFEGFCNPPGGSWNEINILANQTRYTWTSLPRVSATNSKRPDHLIQFFTKNNNYILSVESKLLPRDLDISVGTRLIGYIRDLIKIAPNVINSSTGKNKSPKDWQSDLKQFSIYSAAAFALSSSSDLDKVLSGADTDAAIGLEFFGINENPVIYVKSRKGKEFISEDLRDMFEKSSFAFEVSE